METNETLIAELQREMPGTTNSGEYFTLIATPLGRMGIRPLGGTAHRIRVEPANEEAATHIALTLTSIAGWKQPGDNNQNRFSLVSFTAETTANEIARANGALYKNETETPFEVNKEAPENFRNFLSNEGTGEEKLAAFIASFPQTQTTGNKENDDNEPKEDEKYS